MFDLFKTFAQQRPGSGRHQEAARGLAMRKVDMSSPAVTLRLKRVSQLRHLCLSLGKAKQGDPKRPDSLQNCRQMNLKQGTHDKDQ